MKLPVNGEVRARYSQIAEELSSEAEASASVSVYITADDVARVLGDGRWDPDESPFDSLRKWIIERRRLGFEPNADDVLRWIDDETRPVAVAS